MKFEDVKRVVGAHETTLAKSHGLRGNGQRYDQATLERACLAANAAGVLDNETAGVCANLLAMGTGLPEVIVDLLRNNDA